VECLAMLFGVRVRVRVVLYSLQCPLGVLELHLLILVLLRIDLLFALPLAGRRDILAQLSMLLMELFHELLDFPALSDDVVRGVMHRALSLSLSDA
jgi:hypothetical protein